MSLSSSTSVSGFWVPRVLGQDFCSDLPLVPCQKSRTHFQFRIRCPFSAVAPSPSPSFFSVTTLHGLPLTSEEQPFRASTAPAASISRAQKALLMWGAVSFSRPCYCLFLCHVRFIVGTQLLLLKILCCKPLLHLEVLEPICILMPQVQFQVSKHLSPYLAFLGKYLVFLHLQPKPSVLLTSGSS